MPEEIPAELQEKFMDLVDSCIYKTIHNTKTNYERRVRKNKKELILNQICNDEGDERIDSIIGSEDVECHWGFLDSIENEKLLLELKRLSPKELKLLELKFYNEYSNEEIAKELNYTERSAYVMLNKVINKLKRSMV